MPIWQWGLWEWLLFEAMTVVFLCVVGLVVVLIVYAMEGEEEVSFTVKDSGKREQFASGMVRDTAQDKINFVLVADGPMLKRWADHLTKGAKKYAKRNWMKADGQEELERFCDSAFRHFIQWVQGDQDEDHAAATIFNINGAEYVKERMAAHAQEEAEKEAFVEAGMMEMYPVDARSSTPSREMGRQLSREDLLIEIHIADCPGCPQCIFTTKEPS